MLSMEDIFNIQDIQDIIMSYKREIDEVVRQRVLVRQNRSLSRYNNNHLSIVVYHRVNNSINNHLGRMRQGRELSIRN